MSVEGANQPKRESKPSVLSNALSRLGQKVMIFEDFIVNLKGAKTGAISSDKKDGIPSFNEIYQNLPQILNQFAERIEKCVEEINEMLL
jgi:hypothetical protein